MNLLADSLNLSRVTVWKVLNKKPGVSRETEERVRAALSLLSEEHSDAKPAKAAAAKNITAIVKGAETSMFWMSIVDRLAIELNKKNMGFNFIPYGKEKLSGGDFWNALAPGKTDGLVVVNLYEEPLLSKLAELPLPKIFYDAAPSMRADDLNGDLVLVDGRRAVKQITEDLLQRGFGRLGFIGDVNYARTNALRWEGFAAAHEKNNAEIEAEFCLLKYAEEEDSPRSIGSFLDSLPALPDGFVCVNDYVAFLVLNLLHAKRRAGSEGVRLTGFDDSKEFMLEYRGVTTVRVQKSMLGRRLLNQLVYRMESPTADFEEIYIMPKIVFRDGGQSEAIHENAEGGGNV